MNEYNKTLQVFAGNYIMYCKSISLNISDHCRKLEQTKGIKLAGGKLLWNWRCGQARIVTVYTLINLSSSVNKPLKYFLNENFKLPDTNE